MVSAGHVGGTCGSGIVCFARGVVGGEGSEWLRLLGLGFTSPVFVSTSSAFMRSSDSLPAGPHGRL